jgi:PilZ domain
MAMKPLSMERVTSDPMTSRKTMCDGTGVLTREYHVRVVNISESGCLIETRRRMDVGTVGRLQLNLGGEEYADDIQVVRCQAIAGAGPVYHIGIRLLWTTRRNAGSIRQAVTRHRELAVVEHTTRVM